MKTHSFGRFLKLPLGAPIYLHRTKPPIDVIEASYGGFAPFVTDMLSGPGFGWHIETAVHVLRMVLGGDRFPRFMFSADYPYASIDAARAFLEQVPVTAADRSLIAHGNAEKLVKISAELRLGALAAYLRSKS
ncbi:hypothetical protein L6654_33845 [Bradyrhizobium sp. WYCCWR 13023]|uniref:Amidohydrolase-related domain-containing protein n=1 Tax=Bradyrhizobium zhengyangense TaxID=2911009 RepID=A0A9X1RHY8_9BRAD|nr:hypothetical protein [Bradyrhizobium zhengyangense]MCG2631623.1 hypothetical protein [Bradyrhizobium zhengyangense]